MKFGNHEVLGLAGFQADFLPVEFQIPEAVGFTGLTRGFPTCCLSRFKKRSIKSILKKTRTLKAVLKQNTGTKFVGEALVNQIGIPEAEPRAPAGEPPAKLPEAVCPRLRRGSAASFPMTERCSYKTRLDVFLLQVRSSQKSILQFRLLSGKHPVGDMCELMGNQRRDGIADMTVKVRESGA